MNSINENQTLNNLNKDPVAEFETVESLNKIENKVNLKGFKFKFCIFSLSYFF